VDGTMCERLEGTLLRLLVPDNDVIKQVMNSSLGTSQNISPTLLTERCITKYFTSWQFSIVLVCFVWFLCDYRFILTNLKWLWGLLFYVWTPCCLSTFASRSIKTQTFNMILEIGIVCTWLDVD